MASVSHSLNLERTADVVVNSNTVIALPAGTEALRIVIAANTPKIEGILGGTANRLFMLVNCTANSCELVCYFAPTVSITVRRPTSKSIQAGQGIWLWYDGAAGHWVSLD